MWDFPSKWFRQEAVAIGCQDFNLTKKVHIYRHEYSTLVHHCFSCSQGHEGVGAYPSCVGAKTARHPAEVTRLFARPH